MSIQRHHVIERTSPKGGPFLGTCLLCGARELRAQDAGRECPNPTGTMEHEALGLAIGQKWVCGTCGARRPWPFGCDASGQIVQGRGGCPCSPA